MSTRVDLRSILYPQLAAVAWNRYCVNHLRMKPWKSGKSSLNCIASKSSMGASALCLQQCMGSSLYEGTTGCGTPATNILQLPLSDKYVHLSVDCIEQIFISLFVIGSKKGVIWRISKFSFQNAYISGTIAATDMGLVMNILTSSCYTHKEFRTLPTSDVGRASTLVNHIQKSLFYASLQRLTVRDKMLAVTSNVGSVKQKA